MRNSAFILAGALAIPALLFAVTAWPAEIYRWVDGNGRTHLSEVVPEKYRKSATRVDTSRSEISPEQRRLAEEAAAREKARAEDIARQLQHSAAQAPRAAAVASRPATAKRPAQVVTDATDCATWHRLYLESQACFGPYRTVRGGIKPEAYEACNEIPSPELKCGPARN